MASTEYQRAIHALEQRIDQEVQALPEGFTLSAVEDTVWVWLTEDQQKTTRDDIDRELLRNMLYGITQQMVARYRSGKILHHGAVLTLDAWDEALKAQINVVKKWNELIVPGDGSLRRHKHIMEMTGIDFQAAALTRRRRALVENRIADLWETLGKELGFKRAKEVYPTIEKLAARTLEIQGVVRQ